MNFWLPFHFYLQSPLLFLSSLSFPRLQHSHSTTSYAYHHRQTSMTMFHKQCTAITTDAPCRNIKLQLDTRTKGAERMRNHVSILGDTTTRWVPRTLSGKCAVMQKPASPFDGIFRWRIRRGRNVEMHWAAVMMRSKMEQSVTKAPFLDDERAQKRRAGRGTLYNRLGRHNDVPSIWKLCCGRASSFSSIASVEEISNNSIH